MLARLELSDALNIDERAALRTLAERVYDRRQVIAGEWARRLLATESGGLPAWVTCEHLSDVHTAFLASVFDPLRRGDLSAMSRAYYAMNRRLIEFALATTPDSPFSLASLYRSSAISLQVISEQLQGEVNLAMAYAKLAGHLMMVVGLAYSDCREEAVQGRRDELERVVQERTAALRAANSALQAEVAERKRAEADLRREKMLSDTIIETLPGLFYVIDGSERLVRWNHELERVTGYAAEEIAACHPLDFFSPDVRPALEERLREGFTAGFTSAEADVIAKDGSRHPRLFTSKRVELDQMVSLVGVGIDITARREADERVKREKRFSDAIIDTLPGIFYLFDEHGRFLRWNANLERVSQYSGAEVAAISPLDLFVGPGREEISHRIGQVFRDGYATAQADFVAKDGTATPYFFTGQRVVFDDRPCLIGTGIDITERKRAEDVLRRRTQELARSNADLEQFAYVASHDLQEPLRAVSSYTQLLARRYRERLDGDAQRFIDRSIAAVARMQALIRDLLAYSRIATRGDLFQPIDCEAVLRDVLDDLQAAIAETGAAVTHTVLPVVPGDASQLGQLFQNLIGNAIKFRGEAPPRVHLAADKIGGRWRFSVRDNGIGIEREYADRIFVIFQRLHSRRAYPGTGVGLAICKKIVERHGGRIWVESEPGRGTEVLFELPANATADRPEAAAG